MTKLKNKSKSEMNDAKQNIKPGYKLTAVGVIPEEWEVKRFEECFSHLKTYAFSREELGYVAEADSIYNIHYGDIHSTFPRNILDTEQNKSLIPIIKEPQTESFVTLQDGDIIMADASEDYKGVGQSVELINVGKKKIASGTHTFALRPKIKFAPRYSGYIFSEFNIHKSLKRIATGISVYGLSKSNIAKIHLPIPPLSEQTAIANCLGTWDKGIDTLASLIEAKKQQKKWLMQNLLTGKKRLPGFEGEWKEVRLGEVIRVQGGYAFKSTEFNDSGIPIIRISNLSTETSQIDMTDCVYYKKSISENYGVKKGDMMIAMSGATAGKTAMYTYNQKAYLNQRVGLFKNKNEFVFYYPFIYSLVKTNQFNNEIKKLLSIGAQPNISSQEIEGIVINLPKIKEQTAIATILSTADKEIELLQQKLDAMKEQKRGLMQVLLTGKVRLKGEEQN